MMTQFFPGSMADNIALAQSQAMKQQEFRQADVSGSAGAIYEMARCIGERVADIADLRRRLMRISDRLFGARPDQVAKNSDNLPDSGSVAFAARVLTELQNEIAQFAEEVGRLESL